MFGTLGSTQDDGIAADEEFAAVVLDSLRRRWASRMKYVDAD
jgi:hypothetical protein